MQRWMPWKRWMMGVKMAVTETMLQGKRVAPTVADEAKKNRKNLSDFKRRKVLRSQQRKAEQMAERATRRAEELEERLERLWCAKVFEGVLVNKYWSGNIYAPPKWSKRSDLHAKSLTSPRHGRTYANAHNHGKTYGVNLDWSGVYAPWGYNVGGRVFGHGWTRAEAERIVLEWVAHGKLPENVKWYTVDGKVRERKREM